MTVASILKTKGNAVYTIDSGRMLADAAQLLTERKIGAVVVTDDANAIRGILGEREIVAAIARHGSSVLTHPVRDHMVRAFGTCKRSDSTEHIMTMMTGSRLRHVPVLEDGRLIGIVSIGDIVKRRIEESEREASALREYITMH
ncbi:MAG: CBS domain-containing protein [Alphaproteobacteria bacterium]